MKRYLQPKFLWIFGLLLVLISAQVTAQDAPSTTLPGGLRQENKLPPVGFGVTIPLSKLLRLRPAKTLPKAMSQGGTGGANETPTIGSTTNDNVDPNCMRWYSDCGCYASCYVGGGTAPYWIPPPYPGQPGPPGPPTSYENPTTCNGCSDPNPPGGGGGGSNNPPINGPSPMDYKYNIQPLDCNAYSNLFQYSVSSGKEHTALITADGKMIYLPSQNNHLGDADIVPYYYDRSRRPLVIIYPEGGKWYVQTFDYSDDRPTSSITEISGMIHTHPSGRGPDGRTFDTYNPSEGDYAVMNRYPGVNIGTQTGTYQYNAYGSIPNSSAPNSSCN